MPVAWIVSWNYSRAKHRTLRWRSRPAEHMIKRILDVAEACDDAPNDNLNTTLLRKTLLPTLTKMQGNQ